MTKVLIPHKCVDCGCDLGLNNGKANYVYTNKGEYKCLKCWLGK